MWRDKLETFIDFPIDELDLKPYVRGPQTYEPVYELYAVSVRIAANMRSKSKSKSKSKNQQETTLRGIEFHC
jgi:hypothetical protein